MKFGFSQPKREALSELSGSDEQKAVVFQWLLGRKASGDAQVLPFAHVEAPRNQTDLYEVSRLIRGAGKSAP